MPQFEGVDALVRDACGERFTGAVVRIDCGGRVAFERAYGRVDAVGGAAVTLATRFDLASLTKVFVGTAVLRAVSAGSLEPDRSLSGLVAEWRSREREAISVRRLLAHDAGLQSGADYRSLFDVDVERFALEQPPVAAVGERVVYSDLGFIALGTVLTRATGRALPAAVAETCAALGATATSFRCGPRERASVPATENDAWRGRVRGFVHDEKAYLMGGVAGHAGLFGTAFDVARVVEAYLAHAAGRRSEALPSRIASDAIVEQAYDPVLRRGLGWALKTSDENSCGARMSASAFGHTGFVGTSVWADPERDLSVVVLTNAVYYGRGDLRDFRAAVGDAAVAAVTG